MNYILVLLLIICLSTTAVSAQSDTSLSEQIASSMDGQTISLDGHQALSNPSITGI